MKIIVTGAAGFIGSHVCDALQIAGHEALGLDDLSSTGTMLNLSDFRKHGGRPIIFNILAPGIIKVIKDFAPDIIIHLAAQAAITTSLTDPAYDMQVNGIGTINMLQAALACGVKRFIFSSTSAVYLESQLSLVGKIKENWPTGPSSPYGISKLAAEGYVRTMFPNSIILRFANVYGARQIPIGENQVIARMIRHFQYGDDFFIHGSGNQRRDFVYVSDVVNALVASLTGSPGTYNISTAQSTSINEIGDMVDERYGGTDFNQLPHTDREDPRSSVCMENSLAKSGLGWEPKVEIYEGIRQTVDWWKSQAKK